MLPRSPPHLLPWRSLVLLFLALAVSSNGVSATAKAKAKAPAAPPKPAGFGYKLVSLVQRPNGGGLVGCLQVKRRSSTYGPDIPRLRLFVKHETKDRVRVQITDAEKQRWEVPYDLLPREPSPPLGPATAGGAPFTAGEYPGQDLVFTYGRDPFWFAVHRKSTRQTLFNTSRAPLVFKDQYLEVSTRLPGDAALYGLGENTQPGGIKLRPNDPYTLYTTDASAINLNTDLYGSHPVYVDLRNIGGRGVAHAVLLLNSNGMDVFYTGTSLTYKVIGGLLDFYFFAGPTPLAVVDQYTAMIGRPAPMPYWAFGFHQCRWGYHNLSVVEDVVENYRSAQIPLDVIWNDDDHMDARKDFTLSPVNYPRPKLLAFLNKIHARGMKYIVLIDPGINVNSTYGVYQRGMDRDIFIKLDGQPYLAQVWPGPVYFPDFINPNGASWWIDEVRRFHELVPVDGLWIDMNEASNFCTGKCTIPTTHRCPDPTSKEPWLCCLDCKNITNTRWDDPPYKINASGKSARLGYNTIATSAVHYNGILEYNAHSLYGFSQAIATHKGLQSIQGKRPFILTRSTFVGSGAYAAHWTGDNKGTWEDLRYSISTMLNFGIFGMPMELYEWQSVARSARNALGMRYRMLPYLYTLNYQAHLTGAPVARPLFFSFPDFAPCYGGQATYARFHAAVRGGREVTVLSDVALGSYSMHKGLVIEKITVLGLHGAGKDLAIQVDGADDATAVATSSPYFAAADAAQVLRQGEEEDAVEGEKRGVTMEVGGLALPLGKSFTMTWNMHIEA
uniref:Alpha-xylosidase n=1 Tax=Aegilops tauschii TaxID=37682 RepID=R7WBF0_AEGTA